MDKETRNIETTSLTIQVPTKWIEGAQQDVKKQHINMTGQEYLADIISTFFKRVYSI